jgi:hypothetical protein
VVALVLSLTTGTYNAIGIVEDLLKDGKAEVPVPKPKPRRDQPGQGRSTSDDPNPGIDHTYEPGIDGKPKLFPGYSSGNLPNTEYVPPVPLPAGDASAYRALPRTLEYGGTDKAGKRTYYKVVVPTNERSAALGLDDEISTYNDLAEQLNVLAEDGKVGSPEYLKLSAGAKAQMDKIIAVESAASSAAGTSRPKLVTEEYPKRVQQLATLAYAGKRLGPLSEEDVMMLERYPAIGRPVLKYNTAREKYPDKDATIDPAIRAELAKAQAAGFKLAPSDRPFAEGLHKYPQKVQNVIDRIAESDGRNPVIISERERQAIAEFPELEARVNKYEDEVKAAPKRLPTRPGGRVFEAELPEDFASDASVAEFRTIRANGYRGVEPVASSIAEVETSMAKDRADLRATQTMLKSALSGGMSRAYIEELYRRQNMLRARVAAQQADVSGRGSYLGDLSREALPSNEAERRAFLQLQNVEREFQGHQDALFEYNEMERGLNYSGLTKTQIYKQRLDLLRGIAARQDLTDVYSSALAKSVDSIDEDADSVVNLPDDPEAAKDQGEGMERANIVDPNEQQLFLQTRAQAKSAFKRWEDFSYVAPGFGLGGPQRNTLQRANADTDRRRFASVTMQPARQQMKNPSRPIEMAGPDYRQPLMINPNESDFGEVHYEDAYHNDYQSGRRIIWTDPYLDSGDRPAWNSARSVYQPDNSGYAYAQRAGMIDGRHPVMIGEVAKPREYYGTNRRFYQTNGPNAQLQNIANGFAPNGEMTMITKGRAGREDERVPLGMRDRASAMRAGIYSSRI